MKKTNLLTIFLILLIILLSSCSPFFNRDKEVSASSNQYPDKPFRYNSYHCYPDSNCCRLSGSLDNECIDIDKVI
jgi:hypothetical protein